MSSDPTQQDTGSASATLGQIPGVVQVALPEAIQKNFLPYGLYTIQDRALPDVRDGLKPVHRRIVYFAHSQKIWSLKKSAEIVGGVLGHYHPHGDGSVYGALVNLVQTHKNNIPLFIGQGNWGKLDMPEAAYRYTEAKLSSAAETLVRDIDYVEYQPNFNDELQEPVVLPAELPWFWINGTDGIAVGMNTRLLPHNLGEIIDATLYLIDHPKCDVTDLCKFVRYPDFPTGGYITADLRRDKDPLRGYTTGEGSFRVRARIEKEIDGRRRQLVIRELPYDVPVSRVMAQVEELVSKGKLEGVREITDQSSEDDGMRVVVALKAEAHPDIVTNLLFKHTSCEETFSMINRGLMDRQPRLFTLKTGLEAWLVFRREVVTRRFADEQQKLKARLHIIAGILKIIDKIQAVVRRITESDEPFEMLKADYKLDDEQARAVLALTLQRLSRVSRNELDDERKTKEERLAYVEGILANPQKLDGVIKDELRAHKKKHGHARRTQIVESFSDITIADVTVDEPVVIFYTASGNIKRVKAEEYRSQRRRGKGVLSSSSASRDDVPLYASSVSAHDDLLVVTNRGRAYYLKVYAIPECGRADKGVPMASLLTLQGDERVTALVGTDDLKSGSTLFVVTKQGEVKQVEATQFCKNRKAGLPIIRLKDGDEIVSVLFNACETCENVDVLLFSRQGFANRFKVAQVRTSGRQCGGIRGMRLAKGDQIVSAGLLSADSKGQVLVVSEFGYGKRFDASLVPSRSNRGAAGVKSGNQNAGDIVGAFILDDEAFTPANSTGTLFLTNTRGKSIRIPIDQTKQTSGRGSRGTRLQELDGDERISAVTLVYEPNEAEEE